MSQGRDCHFHFTGEGVNIKEHDQGHAAGIHPLGHWAPNSMFTPKQRQTFLRGKQSHPPPHLHRDQVSKADFYFPAPNPRGAGSQGPMLDSPLLTMMLSSAQKDHQQLRWWDAALNRERRQEKSKEPRQSHNPHVNVIPEILLKTCWTLNNTLERYFIENPQENSARSFMMPFHEWGNRGLQRSNKWLAKAMYLVRGRIWTQVLIEPHPFIWQKENLLGMFFVLNFCFFLALLHNLQDLSVPQPGIEPGSWL